MINLELFLLVGAVLLITGIFASKFFLRFGVPSLLLFLVVGMLAGSDGLGQIGFENHHIAQFLGVIALIFILFYGGFTTDFKQIKPIVKEFAILATLGVALTAILTALAVWLLTPLSFPKSFLLGSIISSTDAPAVFSILRAKNVHLSPKLKSLLELESGSNDPMAVFLTLMATSFLGIGGTSPSALFVGLNFFLQMGVGFGLGYFMARITLKLLKRFDLDYEGLYPVFVLSLVFFTYTLIFFAQGSGFLGVYIMGLFLGKEPFLHKKSVTKFGDGLSWLMQSMMFLILGLLVFPSKMISLAGSGLLISLVLMFLVRPISVFISLAFSPLSLREKTLISWVGLKGAVAIILATFPFLAEGFLKEDAEFLFHMVFFIVLSSTFIQGTTLPYVARWLKLEQEAPPRDMPLELADHAQCNTAMVEVTIEEHSFLCETSMVEARFPEGSLVALIGRQGMFFVPNGSTVFYPYDRVMILTDKFNQKAIEKWVNQTQEDIKNKGDEIVFSIEDYR